MAEGECRYDSPPHLPPLGAAPILEYYDLETRRIDQAHILKAPIDARGVVDIFKTVELALNLVDDEYIWPRENPKPDVHHFVWEREKYHPRHFNGNTIPRDYRDKITFHKGYLPRQFHDFIHVVIAPPPVPDFSVMEARVRDFESARLLFESARGAVTAHRKPGKIAGVPQCPSTGKILLDDEILSQVMANFAGYFENSKREIHPDNEFLNMIEIDQRSPEEVARELGKLAGSNALNLMPIIYGRHRRAKTAA